MQRVIPLNDQSEQLFTFTESIFETDEELIRIMHDETSNLDLFDLVRGLVFRCHLVYHKEISTDDLLRDKDVIIFNFHPALFDHLSLNIFLTDLRQAYATEQLIHNDHTLVQYLDCKFAIFFSNLLDLCCPCG